MPVDPPTIHVDVLIFGGGIAGLWTLARLRREGYSCILLENKALGSGQTIASQGIIHGGIKYALTGKASAASTAISQMPDVWRACLRGTGEVDLRGVRVLSERQYLWTTAGIGSRLVGVAASRVIRTAVRPVPPGDRPPAFAGASQSVDVYSVDEPVLDPASIIRELATSIDAPIIATASAGVACLPVGDERVVGICLVDPRRAEPHGRVTLIPRRWIAAAGAGNEELESRLGIGGTRGDPFLHHQRRPLHMVMARGRLPLLYGHCVGLSDKPRLTITSQIDTAGRTVWYIGGQIAETGVQRSEMEQVAAAREEVRACVPWINLEGTQWCPFRIDRSEGAYESSGVERPDSPVMGATENGCVAYPTKLALAPLLAGKIGASLRLQGLTPSTADLSAMKTWERPPIALLPWHREDLRWT